jgi:hypothetical protein
LEPRAYTPQFPTSIAAKQKNCSSPAGHKKHSSQQEGHASESLSRIKNLNSQQEGHGFSRAEKAMAEGPSALPKAVVKA